MAVKHHQQPIPTVLLEVVTLAGTVPKPEGDGGHSGQVTHGELPHSSVAPGREMLRPMNIHYRGKPMRYPEHLLYRPGETDGRGTAAPFFPNDAAAPGEGPVIS